MLRRISINFVAQLSSLALTLGDRIIVIGILLRVWDADTYADWATILAAAGLISMGEFGLNVYFGNKWQHAYAYRDERAFQRIISVSLSVYLMLGTVLAVLALAFAL